MDLRLCAAAIALLAALPAAAQNRAGCENHDASRSECLETLAPERVLAEVRQLLAARA